MSNNELGERLRNRRQAIRPTVSVRELAKEAEINHLTITNIETGFTPNPGTKTVERIHNALNYFEASKKRISRTAANNKIERLERKISALKARKK